MGTVHLARQVALGRAVALKQIQLKHRQTQSVKDEFLTEAVLTGKLEHPNIVPIYEVAKTPDGELFYSMKNIKGQEWNDTIETLSLDENLDVLLNVSDAIAFAHAEGVVHRDLKPQNIMTGGFGEVLVLDWGLAVLTGGEGDVDASAAGTPAYMAPEMVNPPFTVGPRSDIYLLGAILFKILTGTTPHAGRSARDCLEAASKNEIVSPVEERVQKLDPSGELLGVALRAIATRPQDRFQSVPELQQAIRGFLSHRESLELSGRAQGSLESAESNSDYTEYCRAVFGFEEVVKLWGGNVAATDGAAAARLAWALCAEAQSDFDLSLSLLHDTTGHHEIRARVHAARGEREARQQRIRWLRRVSMATSLTVAVVASVAAVWIDTERGRTETQRLNAVASEKAEATQRRFADNARALAEIRADEAELNLKIAERNAYHSDMLIAQRGWKESNISHLIEVLDRYRDRDDLKGFEWSYWDRVVHSDLLTLRGHTQMIHSVAFSPDGQMLVSGSDDETVKVWDVASGQEQQTLKHPDSVYSVAFSPDGTRLCSASDKVRVWNVATWQETLTLSQGDDFTGIWSLAFSPDGTKLASASSQAVRVWDMTTGQEILALDGDECVAFSPDGQRLASRSVSEHESIKVWDVVTGQETLTLEGHTSQVRSIAFSSDGTRLSSASFDRTVKVWDAETGQETLTLDGHTSPVSSIAFSPDGQSLASGSYDQTVKVWDVETGLELLTLKGHTSRVQCVAFSPDGTQLTSASFDRTVKVWNATSRQDSLTLKHPSSVNNVAFSPNGQRLASASNTVKVWDIATGQETLTLEGRSPVRFSPNGQWLASPTDSKTLTVWDAATGQETLTLKHNGEFGICSIAFSPDGTRLASASHDTMRVWDVVTGKETIALEGLTGRVSGVAFSDDGRLAAGYDKRVKVWDADTGQELDTLKGHTHVVYSVDFSPNGKQLGSASLDHTVKVWDAATGQELLTLKGHAGFVFSVALSPDEERLASASYDKTARVWEVATGHETLTLEGHSKTVTDVAYNPDGTMLASGSGDKEVRIWDARPWTPELRTQSRTRGYLTVHRDRVDSLEELRAVIRSDSTISEMVRKQALDWVGLFWKNRSGRE